MVFLTFKGELLNTVFPFRIDSSRAQKGQMQVVQNNKAGKELSAATIYNSTVEARIAAADGNLPRTIKAHEVQAVMTSKVDFQSLMKVGRWMSGKSICFHGKPGQ